MCKISKVTDINKDKERCLPNMDYIGCHLCKIKNITAECKLFMNYRKKLHRDLQNTSMTAKQGILKGS